MAYASGEDTGHCSRKPIAEGMAWRQKQEAGSGGRDDVIEAERAKQRRQGWAIKTSRAAPVTSLSPAKLLLLKLPRPFHTLTSAKDSSP